DVDNFAANDSTRIYHKACNAGTWRSLSQTAAWVSCSRREHEGHRRRTRSDPQGHPRIPPGAHPGRRKIRPDVGAALPAGPAHELILDVGKPDIIWPSVGAHLDRVAAFMVGAVDQYTAHAHFTHLGERDLVGAGKFGHPGIEARDIAQGKPRIASAASWCIHLALACGVARASGALRATWLRHPCDLTFCR